MEHLKKGIILGLGLSKLNKKEVRDFVLNLYRKGYLSKEQADELARTILEKSKNQNAALEDKIKQYVRNVIKKEELATLEHIDYLEKRIELLEEEVDKLVLERELDEMSDDELENLLDELGIDFENDSKKKKKTKTKKSKEVTDDYEIEFPKKKSKKASKKSNPKTTNEDYELELDFEADDEKDLDQILRELGIDPKELEEDYDENFVEVENENDDELFDDLLDLDDKEIDALLDEIDEGESVPITTKKSTTKKKTAKKATTKKTTKETKTAKKKTSSKKKSIKTKATKKKITTKKKTSKTTAKKTKSTKKKVTTKKKSTKAKTTTKKKSSKKAN